MSEMNERQRDMARHALGFPNPKNVSYRNRFCIGPGSDGYEDWIDLVHQGLAVRVVAPAIWGENEMFYLKLKGALMVRETSEHLSAEDTEQMRKLESQ